MRREGGRECKVLENGSMEVAEEREREREEKEGGGRGQECQSQRDRKREGGKGGWFKEC